MSFAYLALGSNLGDRKQHLKDALNIIKQKCKLLKASPIYETMPVGDSHNTDQPTYYNQVIKVETQFSPPALLKFLLGIETKCGRVRTSHKNAPRTIDIDILFYDDKIIEQEELIIPHQRLHERSFVLKPLHDLTPRHRHPLLNETVHDLWLKLKQNDIIRIIP